MDGFSRAELELALDAGRAGTFRIDPATGAVRWSQSLAALMGLDADRAPGGARRRAGARPSQAIAHGSARRSQRAFETGTLDGLELRAVRADGTTRWFAVRGRLEDDAVGLGARCSSAWPATCDEEHSLHGDRAVLDGLFAVAPVGLALLDTDLRYVRVNPALAAMNGVRGRRAPRAHAERRPRRPAAPRSSASCAACSRRASARRSCASTSRRTPSPARRGASRSASSR